MSPADAHRVLGLPYNASKDEVKQAYRKLCLLHHPDLCPPDKRAEAERTFKLITEAYSKLASGDTRQWTGSSARQGVARQRSTYSWHRAPAGRSSNGLVALAFCLPLVLAGVHVALNRGGRTDLGDGTRPHGLLNPPVNPWLADRYKPRQWNRSVSSLEGPQALESSSSPGRRSPTRDSSEILTAGAPTSVRAPHNVRGGNGRTRHGGDTRTGGAPNPLYAGTCTRVYRPRQQ